MAPGVIFWCRIARTCRQGFFTAYKSCGIFFTGPAFFTLGRLFTWVLFFIHVEPSRRDYIYLKRVIAGFYGRMAHVLRPGRRWSRESLDIVGTGLAHWDNTIKKHTRQH